LIRTHSVASVFRHHSFAALTLFRRADGAGLRPALRVGDRHGERWKRSQADTSGLSLGEVQRYWLLQNSGHLHEHHFRIGSRFVGVPPTPPAAAPGWSEV